MKISEKVIDQFRVENGSKFRLKDFDPAWCGEDSGYSEKQRREIATQVLQQEVSDLVEMQERLYASDTWSVLLIFQAMDAAGKDGTIRHVMSGVNPQGCQVTSFKHPSAEELDHTFLWRCTKALPERGRIGIFNRSYYEEVLIVKVHQELVAAQRIPEARPGKKFWEHRYEEICDFEKHLARNGTLVLKFFLNVSKEEQRKRFLERLRDDTKHWKFSPSDLAERAFWDDYMVAYEDAIRATATPDAPWIVVPADHKWVARAIVARTITDAVGKLDLKYPTVPHERLRELEVARKQLEAEGKGSASKKRKKSSGKKSD